MKRYSVEEIEGLLKGTTEGDWDESKIGTVYRSSSLRPGMPVIMAQVKQEDGSHDSNNNRPNAILMTIARNLAVDLLDMKTHRYGQEDCCGCEDRDGQIETAQESAAMWMRRADSFESTIERLKKELAGSQDALHKAFQVIRNKDQQLRATRAENLHMKEVLRPDQVGEALREADSDVAFLESTDEFTAKRLRRLANLVGAATPGPSDEELLGCAGTVLGSICRIVEGLLKTREMECKDCQHINFHEECHAVQEKTAVRCIELAATFNDGHHPLGMQARIAAAIREEFGVEDGGICLECSSDSTITTQHMNGVQGDGQEAGVTTYLCLPCRNQWSE